MAEVKQIHRILEGLIFAANEPMSLDRLLEFFDESQRPDKKTIKEALDELSKDYENRGIELKHLASGYQFQVKADLSPWVKKIFVEKPQRYSRALMETLALIAYRQPITRAEIEEVRGVVVSSNITRTLLEHGWVRTVGHRDIPGKPALYATTKQFLDHFGLKSLAELPTLSEIQSIETLTEGLEKKLEHLHEAKQEEADSLVLNENEHETRNENREREITEDFS